MIDVLGFLVFVAIYAAIGSFLFGLTGGNTDDDLFITLAVVWPIPIAILIITGLLFLLWLPFYYIHKGGLWLREKLLSNKKLTS